VSTVFRPTPGPPWVEDGRHPDAMTRAEFVSAWGAVTCLDPRTTLEYLIYLGASSFQAAGALQSRRRRPIEFPSPVLSGVFRCLVIGAKGSGKSALCHGLPVRLPLPGRCRMVNWKPNGLSPECFVGPVVPALEGDADVNEPPRLMIMHELSSDAATRTMSSKTALSAFDVVALTYDLNDPLSFAFAHRAFQSLADPLLPCVFVGTKSDLETIAQTALDGSRIDPTLLCMEAGLPQPVLASTKGGVDTATNVNVYSVLCHACVHPHLAAPAVATLRQPETPLATKAMKTMAVVVVVAMSLAARRWLQRR